MSNSVTYCLGLVTQFLDDLGVKWTPSNAHIGISFYTHGCRVKLNDMYMLSIQTHTDIIGDSFAETGLQNTKIKKMVYDGTFGYYDVIRFCTPDSLFQHLREVFQKAGMDVSACKKANVHANPSAETNTDDDS